MKRAIRSGLPSLFAVLLALAPGAVRAADCFDWPKTLAWADFKGPVPAKVTKAAQDAKEAHDKVGKAKTELENAKTELKNKQTERQGVLDERKKELDKVDAEFDPKIKAKIEERAKAAETPAEAKAKATDAVNNNAKLSAKDKAGKLTKIDNDFKAAQAKYDLPANKKARESKLAGFDKEIAGLEKQKSTKREGIVGRYDKKLDPIDKDIEKINKKIEAKEGDLKKAEDAEEEAQKALGKVELAATSSTPIAGKLEMEACGKIKDLPVKAIFCPDESYVLPQAKQDGSPALLAHEQVHFDISGKHAQLFKQEVKKLIDAFNAKFDNLNKCQPKDLNEALKKALADFHKDLAAASEKGMAAFNAEQKAYDDETEHGTKEAEQKTWSDKIADDLKPK